MRFRPSNLLKLTDPRRSRAQSGQAIVLIALMAVGLIGVTGLALDGGSLLFLQRKAQTTAEMVAMSLASAACENNGTLDDTRIEEITEDVAGENDIAISEIVVNDTAADMKSPHIEINSPATGGLYAGRENDQEVFYEVFVRLPKDPYFIQLVYRGDMIAQGRSVTRCTGGEGSGDGYVLFATGRNCGVSLRATGRGIYLGGSVWGNSSVQIQPSGGTTSYVSGTVNYVNEKHGAANGGWPHLSVNGHPADSGGFSSYGIIQGPPKDAPLLFDIRDFDIDAAGYGSKARAADAEDMYFKITGRRYDWGGPSGNPQFPSDEGLVYVTGDLQIGFAGGTTTFNSGPRGITIVATGTIQFTGPEMNIEPYIDGLTLFSTARQGSPSCDQDTIISSADHNNFKGMIYAPYGVAHITMTGVSSAYGSIVGYGIQIGAENSSIRFMGTSNAGAPPIVSYVE